MEMFLNSALKYGQSSEIFFLAQECHGNPSAAFFLPELVSYI